MRTLLVLTWMALTAAVATAADAKQPNILFIFKIGRAHV